MGYLYTPAYSGGVFYFAFIHQSGNIWTGGNVKIIVNGKPVEVNGQMRMDIFLKKRGFEEGKVIVEYNGVILTSKEWKNVILSPEDRMEIVTFVGGG